MFPCVMRGCSPDFLVMVNQFTSPNKYETIKLICRPEKLSPQFKRRIVYEVKNKTSTSKILKSLVNVPSRTRTITRYLNNEKIGIRKEFIVQG